MSSVELVNDTVLVKHATGHLSVGIYRTPRVEDNVNVLHQRIHTIRLPKRTSDGSYDGVPEVFSTARLYDAATTPHWEAPAEDGMKPISDYLVAMKGILSSDKTIT